MTSASDDPAGSKSGPSVSVVMTVLDPHPVYFPEAVASVLRQTYRNLELVIVEDPSATSAAGLLRQFSDDRIIHLANSVRTSHSRQRNQSIAAARAEYIATVDADDICHPDRLAKQVEFLDRNPQVAVVGTQLQYIDEFARPRGWRAYPTSHADILAALPRFNPIAQPSVMFRKSAIVAAGGYNYDRFPAVEDYDLWSRLAHRGLQFANLPEALVKYRLHPAGMKAIHLHGMLRGTLAVKRRHWQARQGLRGRVRQWLEHLLLLAPAALTYRLFTFTHARRRPFHDYQQRFRDCPEPRESPDCPSPQAVVPGIAARGER